MVQEVLRISSFPKTGISSYKLGTSFFAMFLGFLCNSMYYFNNGSPFIICVRT